MKLLQKQGTQERLTCAAVACLPRTHASQTNITLSGQSSSQCSPGHTAHVSEEAPKPVQFAILAEVPMQSLDLGKKAKAVSMCRAREGGDHIQCSALQ